MFCRAVQDRLGGPLDYSQARANLAESKAGLALHDALLKPSTKGSVTITSGKAVLLIGYCMTPTCLTLRA